MTETETDGLARELGRLRVLELGQGVALASAGKHFADLGAQVIKVEPPDGDPSRRRGPFRGSADPDRSGLFVALNTGKQSLVVDLVDDASLERLRALTEQADLVLTDLDDEALRLHRVDLERLCAARPALVVCSIRPFGRVGAYAGFVAEELTVTNAGGWAYLSPGTSTEPARPPLKVAGQQADYHAGLAAALVSLAAVHRAERTGTGDLVDLAGMAHVTGMLEAAFIAASYLDENPSRLGSRLLQPWAILPCSDGLIFLVCVEQDQWERLVAFMGDPEWADPELFGTPALRSANADLLELFLRQWSVEHTVEELWHGGQARRICFAPVLTMADLAEQDHLVEREFFVDVDHPAAGRLSHLGAPFRSSRPIWRLGGPAPRLDPEARPTFAAPVPCLTPPSAGRDHDDSRPLARPLAGMRVLDFTWVWAGPYGGMHLAFLGAEVIKIESSRRPGLGRRLPLHPPGVTPSLNTCAYFNQWDQGKLSCEIDLGRPESIELIKELVAVCDVVVENFATGVMDKLGLGYETLRAINPDLIMASISGYGSSGPLRNYMGYGPTTGPLSGLSSMTGYRGGPPEELGISVGDPAAGLTAAFAICAAYAGSSPGSRGTHLDISLWEATAVHAVDGWMAYQMHGAMPERMGNRDAVMAPHGCFRTRGDDQWISIACASDQQWRRLATRLVPDAATDARFATAAGRKRHEDELDALLEAACAPLDRWDLTKELQALGVAAFPSMSPQDLLADPHLWARDFFERFDHPEVGRQTHTGVPWRSSTGPNGVMARAPLVGEHTEQVLADLLQVDQDTMHRLRLDGIIGPFDTPAGDASV